MGRLNASVLAIVCLVPSTATAHIALTEPTPRYDGFDNSNQKNAPCGPAGDPPAADVRTTLQGGTMAMVVVDEWIAHEGHLRVAIAPSTDELISPSAFDDLFNADNVIVDDFADPRGPQVHQIEFEVPDIDCPECVLQVIQVMYDNDGFQPNDLYFQCADIRIEPSVGGSEGSGGSMGAGSSETGSPGTTTGDMTTETTGTTGPATSSTSTETASSGATTSSTSSTPTEPDTSTTGGAVGDGSAASGDPGERNDGDDGDSPASADDEATSTGGCSLPLQPRRPGFTLLLLGLFAVLRRRQR